MSPSHTLRFLPYELHHVDAYLAAATGRCRPVPKDCEARRASALRSTLLLSWGAIDACKRGDRDALVGLNDRAQAAFAYVCVRWDRTWPTLGDAHALARIQLGGGEIARARTPAFGNPRTPPPDELAGALPALERALQDLAVKGRAQAGGPQAARQYVREVCAVHLAFEELHPYDNANGRVGRLLLAWQLRAAGLEPPRWQVADRIRYAEAFPARDVEALTAMVCARSPGAA